MKLSEAIELQDAALAGVRSDVTRSGYRAALTAFLMFAGDIDVNEITPNLIRRWKVDMMKPQERKWGATTVNRPYSLVTVAHRLKNLKRLTRWLWREEMLDKEPFQRVVIPNPRPKVQELESHEVEAVVKAAGEHSIRTLAMVLFMIDTGCRVGGLVRVELRNIDIKRCEAVVVEKGDKLRTVFFTELTGEVLTAYLLTRPNVASPAFFISQQGKPYTTRGVYLMVKSLGETVGVKVSPHKFRHTAARGWLQAGLDVGTVSQLLGHTSPVITVLHYGSWSIKKLKRFHGEATMVNEELVT